MKVRSQDLVSQDLDGELVILDLRSSHYLRLNETGAFLWRELEGGASPEALVDALLDEFEVDERTAHRDVSSLLERLEEHGLLADSAA